MWLPGPSVAVITGASTGIGFEVVKNLVQDYDGTIYLTCRNESKGLSAIDDINQYYNNETIPTKRYYHAKTRFYQLDVTNETNIEEFSKHIRKNHGGINMLINNAAVHERSLTNMTYNEKVNKTIETNYFGILRMCHFLFPLLRQHARVVHVTSNVGHVSKINNTNIVNKFVDKNMTQDDLTALVYEYLEDVQHSRHLDKGWPKSPYCLSKIAVSKLAMIQQNLFRNFTADFIVNSVNPGYARTPMTKYTGIMEADEAADAIMYAACIGEYRSEPRGRLIWNNKEIQDWNCSLVKIYDHPSRHKFK